MKRANEVTAAKLRKNLLSVKLNFRHSAAMAAGRAVAAVDYWFGVEKNGKIKGLKPFRKMY
ncbi:MAG: hypothetical protein JXB29_01520 [Sedimentisphaerales bacterium]|nr:hypothetical protein [Sedimentisphaerales bacterium]